MKNRTISLTLTALVAGIVLCLAGYLAIHPQKMKTQAQRVQTVNTVRTVTIVQNNSNAPVLKKAD
jgi:hypothetical protein